MSVAEMLLANATESRLGMSNIDHSIDRGFAKLLTNNPGKVYGRHSAVNFNAIVYWNGSNYVSIVMRYKRVVDTKEAHTLRELMKAVNDDWGWE